MQKNLLLSLVGVVCLALFSSCGTVCKKDEAAKPTTEQAAPAADQKDAKGEVAQADQTAAPAATEQVAQATPEMQTPVEASAQATAPATEVAKA